MRRLFETKENRERWRDEYVLKGYERHEDPELGVVWGTRNRIVKSRNSGTDMMVFDLIVFIGSASKPHLNVWCRTPESREASIKNCLDAQRRVKACKDEKRAARKEASESPNPAKVGDILCSSWGYDQTNVDWYQVVEVKGKNTVVVREIAANSTTTGWERGDCSPIKDRFLNSEKHPPKTCRVNKSKDGYSVKVRDWGVWAYYCPEGEKASHFWTSYH